MSKKAYVLYLSAPQLQSIVYNNNNNNTQNIINSVDRNETSQIREIFKNKMMTMIMIMISMMTKMAGCYKNR